MFSTTKITLRRDTILTRRAMGVKRNIEARWCKQCCSGKAIHITQTVCVFVALSVVHYAMRVRPSVVCGLPGSTVRISPHYLINGTIFEKVTEYKKNDRFNLRLYR